MGRVLILGGAGTFGSRVARLLSREPSISLLLAGRTLAPLSALIDTLPRTDAGAARAQPAVLDLADGSVIKCKRVISADLGRSRAISCDLG